VSGILRLSSRMKKERSRSRARTSHLLSSARMRMLRRYCSPSRSKACFKFIAHSLEEAKTHFTNFTPKHRFPRVGYICHLPSAIQSKEAGPQSADAFSCDHHSLSNKEPPPSQLVYGLSLQRRVEPIGLESSYFHIGSCIHEG